MIVNTPPPRQNWWNRPGITGALKVLVTLLGLYLVLSSLNLQNLLGYFESIRPGWMIAGTLLIIASVFLRAYRWGVILRGAGATITFKRLVILYFVGSFYNAFLPSGLGGDVVRAAEATRDVDSGIAVGTVFVDRLTGLMALFMMAFISLPFRPEYFSDRLAWLIGTISLVGLISGLTLVDGRLLSHLVTHLPKNISLWGNGFFSRLMTAVASCGRPTILKALLISIGFNIIQVGWWLTTGLALGMEVSFLYYLLVVPVMAIALLIPSIGGLGVREWLAPTLFAGAGVSSEAAVALTLLVFALERVASLIGAPIYIYSSIRQQFNQKDPENGAPLT